jgi:hypothetical protein
VGTVQIIRTEIKSDPFPAKSLSGFARGATPRKRIKDHITLVRQESYEEFRELDGETRRVGLDLFFSAALEVVTIGVVVSQRQEIRWNGARISNWSTR